MNTMNQTEEFALWLKGLRDPIGQAKILGRIKRAERSNFGDTKHFDGISEMRIDVGPGYRVYYAKKNNTVYLLLVGGDKSSQAADIRKAKALWSQLKG